MWQTIRSACLALGACAALAVTGCGGNDTVARIDGVPDGSITKAEVNHWMQALTGSDFREAVGVEGPSGLVSDPPDYPRCVAAAKLVSARSFFNQLRPSRAKLTNECRTLYEAVKAQTLNFLISARWSIAEGKKRGVVVTNRDVARTFAIARRSVYPTEERLHRYLVERQWSLSDLLYRLKLATLADRLRPQEHRSTASDGGVEATLTDLTVHRERLASMTHCGSGYIAPNCSEYHGGSAATASPTGIIKHLAWKRP